VGKVILKANGSHTLRATLAASSEISRPITCFPASANAATSWPYVEKESASHGKRGIALTPPQPGTKTRPLDSEKSSVFRIDSSGGADLPKSQGVTFSVHSDCHAAFSEENANY